MFTFFVAGNVFAMRSVDKSEGFDFLSDYFCDSNVEDFGGCEELFVRPDSFSTLVPSKMGLRWKLNGDAKKSLQEDLFGARTQGSEFAEKRLLEHLYNGIITFPVFKDGLKEKEKSEKVVSEAKKQMAVRSRRDSLTGRWVIWNPILRRDVSVEDPEKEREMRFFEYEDGDDENFHVNGRGRPLVSNEENIIKKEKKKEAKRYSRCDSLENSDGASSIYSFL